MNKPKILFLDIETAPIIGYVWGLFDQNVGLSQVHTDWYILSWAAKWHGSKEVMYQDLRSAKPKDTDKPILKKIWELIDEADVIVTQNGVKFDAKKLNARFVFHGFQPPAQYKHVDTLRIAKKRFGFTSNKLAYMTEKLNVKYKKLTHHKFEGFDLWKECLAGNVAAWKEMEKYNKHDVLALEELYEKLVAWDPSINFHVYNDGKPVCTCGSQDFLKRGFYYTSVGKFQRYRCNGCGKENRDGKNLLSGGKDKLRGITRE